VARLHPDGKSIFLHTGDVDQFYAILNEIAPKGVVKIEAVAPADDDANAIYEYLIGFEGGTLGYGKLTPACKQLLCNNPELSGGCRPNV
jgi:hypothetical protein